MTTTEAKWTKRVSAWRASDQTAEEYSRGRGFAAGTLRWWSSRLRRVPREVRLARVVARPSIVASAARVILVEVADARVHVPSDAAREHVLVVLDALEARVRGSAH